jgi:hypothetical protein
LRAHLEFALADDDFAGGDIHAARDGALADAGVEENELGGIAARPRGLAENGILKLHDGGAGPVALDRFDRDAGRQFGDFDFVIDRAAENFADGEFRAVLARDDIRRAVAADVGGADAALLALLAAFEREAEALAGERAIRQRVANVFAAEKFFRDRREARLAAELARQKGIVEVQNVGGGDDARRALPGRGIDLDEFVSQRAAARSRGCRRASHRPVFRRRDCRTASRE